MRDLIRTTREFAAILRLVRRARRCMVGAREVLDHPAHAVSLFDEARYCMSKIEALTFRTDEART